MTDNIEQLKQKYKELGEQIERIECKGGKLKWGDTYFWAV